MKMMVIVTNAIYYAKPLEKIAMNVKVVLMDIIYRKKNINAKNAMSIVKLV